MSRTFLRYVTMVVAHAAVFAILLAATVILAAARLTRLALRRADSGRPAGRLHLLISGTFYNEGWFRSHILPLSMTSALERIYVVTDRPLFDVAKVVYVCPAPWVMRILGRPLSRALTVLWASFRHRPDVLMGYHIMPNAILCLVAAALVGGRAIYQMTGGPIQIIGGGCYSENTLLRRLQRPSKVLETLLFHLVRCFDVVVVRGRKGRQFVRDRRLCSSDLIITGSVDSHRFRPGNGARSYDLITVARLNPYKGVQYLVEIAGELARRRPAVRIAVVGDGPLLASLRDQASRLAVRGNIEFLGKRADISDLLVRSRVFVLTSPSEGMSIAMLEAMSAGLPVAVTDVGDLADAFEGRSAGSFLPAADAAEAAKRLDHLLDDEQQLEAASRAARRAVEDKYAVEAVSSRWDLFFSGQVN